MTYGIGLVGTGMISNFHAKAIADSDHGQLVGCYGHNQTKTADFAAKYGCTAHASLDAMLADPNIHVIGICTPSGAHRDPAVAAARAGKHVLVEKPLEVTTAKCDAIIEACRAANVKLAVAFQSRFHQSARLLKSAIDAGRFGKITLGDCYLKWYRSQEYYDSGAWRGTWELDGGGALMNQAVHTVDLLLWLMGPVDTVYAMADTMTHQRIEVEDVVVATVKFKSGALGVIEATTTTYPGALKRVEIGGSAGSAVLEEEDIKQWQFAEEVEQDEEIRRDMAGKTKSGGGAADPSAIGHHGHTAIYNELLGAIAGTTTLSIDGAEARRSIELIEAVYQSAKTGQPVKLS